VIARPTGGRRGKKEVPGAASTILTREKKKKKISEPVLPETRYRTPREQETSKVLWWKRGGI